jgi:eukaryotic-like serine/threonine-protein kinase
MDQSNDDQRGGVSINSNGTTTIEGDVIGRDKITNHIINKTVIKTAMTSPEDDAIRRQRAVLLEKVENRWVKRVLEHSVHGAALLELGKEVHSGLVEHPWEMNLRVPGEDERRVPANENIADLFRELEESLLIVGDPGTGKSTTLLELTRALCARMREDESQPVPVFLNLASWGNRRLPLADWLVEELNAEYQVNRALGRIWLQQNRLALMLDGLDEVAVEARRACIEAINAFWTDHGAMPIAVTSRLREYQECGVLLIFFGGVLIQKLTDAQVERFLESGEQPLAALRQAIHSDTNLRELARTPLMLSVMALAYQGSGAVETGIAAANEDALRQQIFAAYVRRMFELEMRTNTQIFSRERTQTWLTWLACQMTRHNQPLFLIERLQPSWLERPGAINLLRLVSSAVAWLCVTLISMTVMQPAFVIFMDKSEYEAAWPFYGGIVRPALGMAWGLIAVLVVRRLYHPITSTVIGAALGIVMGLSVGGVTRLHPEFGFITGLVTCVIVAGVAEVFGRQRREPPGADEIRLVEVRRWLWRNGWQGLALGVFMGSMVWFVFGLTILLSNNKPLNLENITGILQMISPFGIALVGGMGLALGVVFGLLGGQPTVGSQDRPNEGIRRSVRTALLAGSATVAALAGPFLLASVSASFALANGINAQPSFFITERIVPLALLGLAMGGTVGLIVALLNGGYAVLQHYLLRLMLWRRGLPWKWSRFLDYAAERIFLQKAGGGYQFIHRYLQEYFASQDDGWYEK